MYKTSKRVKNKGKMLGIGRLKLAVVQGHIPPGMSAERVAEIKEQVMKRLIAQQHIKQYQPFTSASPKRRPRQVGAGTEKD